MSATLPSSAAPSGISFPPTEHQIVSCYWKAWRTHGVSVLITGDHETYEEMIEVCPFGAGTAARWLVYMEPAGMVCVDDMNEGTPGALNFLTVDSALAFIGAEIEADALDRAGDDPGGCPV